MHPFSVKLVCSITAFGSALQIHAVAQMGHKNAKLLDAVANEVMGRIKDFQPALLASLMWSFALLGHLHTHLTDAVTQHALFKLRSMDIPTICQLVCAFALLRHKDAITDVFLDAVSDEAIKRIRSFEATDMVIWWSTSVSLPGCASLAAVLADHCTA